MASGINGIRSSRGWKNSNNFKRWDAIALQRGYRKKKNRDTHPAHTPKTFHGLAPLLSLTAFNSRAHPVQWAYRPCRGFLIGELGSNRWVFPSF